MDVLVEVINQLQDVFAASGQMFINLPQIVVVGTQSSGKSSVLEQIVGKSFLPRGTGIVTRCPLILQLVQTQESTEYAVFQHDKSKEFTDNDLIRKEISEETERIAGTNLNICSTPIILKLYSPNLINLTLVDLPGLTKVPVGDQPPDIEVQIRSLVQEYIENEDAIIVAVTPANVDIANSESLKIAKEVDPEGKRTLAVITKLDLMDRGTDAWDVLGGKIIPVKLGIIGVVNRSQQDILDKKPISESLQDEAKFFQKNYSSIADYHGSTFLANRVQELLIKHIKRILPKLKMKIQEKLTIYSGELRLINNSSTDKHALLLDLIAKFCKTFKEAIRGDLSDVQTTSSLCGGAKVLQILRDDFSADLKSVVALEGFSKEKIITDMRNACGIYSSVFVPEIAFELMVKKEIARLREPSLNCLDKVATELNNIIQNSVVDKNLGIYRYPKLQRKLSTFVPQILESRLPKTSLEIETFIDGQICYINKSHPDFEPNCGNWLQKVSARFQNATLTKEIDEDRITVSSKEKGEIDYTMVRRLIESYFSIVKKTIHDTVPKIIMHLLIEFLTENLQNELIQKLYKNENGKDYMEESKDIMTKRAKLEKEVKALREAMAITNNFLPAIDDVVVPKELLKGQRSTYELQL